VRGVRSTTLVRSRRAHGKGNRLLLLLIILFAGAGFAAAAWRIKTQAIRAQNQSDRAASRERRQDRSGHAQIAEASPLAFEREASRLREAELSAIINHRRVSHQPDHRVVMVRGADPTPNVEMAFAQGWSALRTGDFEVAAEAFGRAASQPEKSALSEDGSFWEAVALDRDQRWTDAQKAFTHFLTRYPESDRTGEAAVMLGWLLLRAGDVRAAEVRFESALGDPVERVRRSAQAGLEASGRHPN
jgi:tetratricopeptide (TPR) repeat protein